MPPKIGAKVKLGGKLRTLRYTAPVLARIQDERDDEPLVDTINAVGRVSISAISVMVWGGLLHEDPALTVEQAMELIEPPMRPTINAIVEALKPWIGDETEAEPSGT